MLANYFAMLYMLQQKKSFRPDYLGSSLWGNFSLVLIVSLFLLGCGYKFTVKKDLPLGIDRVFVEVFKNKTDEVGLESLLTNEFIRQMTRHLPLGTISRSREDSTTIVKGEIISLYSDDLFYDENYLYTSHRTRQRIVVSAKLSLQNKGGVTIWSVMITETNDYDLVPDDTRRNIKRREAISVLIEKLSKSAFHRLTENF